MRQVYSIYHGVYMAEHAKIKEGTRDDNVCRLAESIINNSATKYLETLNYDASNLTALVHLDTFPAIQNQLVLFWETLSLQQQPMY